MCVPFYLVLLSLSSLFIYGCCCPTLVCHQLLTSAPLFLQESVSHWPSFLRRATPVLQALAGLVLSSPLQHPMGKEMGQLAVCRADHWIATELSPENEVPGLRTWRPSKPFCPADIPGGSPSSPSCAPASGAACQLPPSTAAGVGAAVGRARPLPSSRPRRVSSGRRAQQGAGTAGLCLPWPWACGASRGAASGCCWVSSLGCSAGGDPGLGGQHLNAPSPYSGHGLRQYSRVVMPGAAPPIADTETRWRGLITQPVFRRHQQLLTKQLAFWERWGRWDSLPVLQILQTDASSLSQQQLRDVLHFDQSQFRDLDTRYSWKPDSHLQ